MNGEDTDTDNEALAATALQHFKEHNATKAIDCLSKLRNKGKENDPKILHNIAITEYYLNGSSDPQKLLDDFNKVKAMITEKSSSTQAESGESQEDVSPPEDIDTALLQYNQAVILYQTRKYASALEILTKLYRTIEPIEDYLAVRICFLLVDIYLILKQTEKGFAVIAYLEKLYANLTKPVEDKSAQEKEEKEKEKEREKEKEKEKKGEVSDSIFPSKPEALPPSSYSYDSPTKVLCLSALELDFAIHLYKAKLHLQRPSTDLDLAKEEIKLAMAAGTKVHPLAASMCVFMKAHQEYLRQNYKKAIALMQACAQKNGPTGATSVAPNNGCLGLDVNFEGPVPVFTSSSTNNNSNQQQNTNNATALAPLFFNNLGCIHYKLKKFSAASFYLNKALKDSDNNSSSSPNLSSNNGTTNGENDIAVKKGISSPSSSTSSVDQYARDRKLEMLYNLGLQLLLTGKAELAFQAFQEVALMHYCDPRVWLRLAESCVATHVLKLREEAKNTQKSPLVWKVVGGNGEKGSTRHILLPTTGGPHRGLQVKDSETSGEEAEETTPSASTRMGTMSLEYAAKCLRNCLFLLHRLSTPSSTDPSSPQTSSTNENNRPSTPTSPVASSTSSPSSSPPPSGANGIVTTSTANLELINEMRQAALANLAFVSLALANPVVALTSAQDLLSLSEHVQVYKYLAHVYAAESLCMLGRATEALDHLSPSIIDDLIPSSSPSPLQGTHPSPYSSLTSSQPISNVARNMLYTNLAAAHILRDDLANAQTCITQALTFQPGSAKAQLQQVYIELRRGHVDQALDLLKRGRPIPKRKAKR